jgi:hypothetical protein
MDKLVDQKKIHRGGGGDDDDGEVPSELILCLLPI